MKKILIIFFVLCIFFSMIFSGCQQNANINNNSENKNNVVENSGQNTASENEQDDKNSKNKNTQLKENDGAAEYQEENIKTKIDFEKVKPNEAGEIMVVMFHNFVEKYEGGDKEFTTTFDDFKVLLQTLYDKGYRLINVKDYLDNNISVPAGCIPMIFTFDDGTSGQFNLVEENGKLVANKRSAVGIMEEFNETHPDFGLKGTFYINLGNSTFEGEGTLEQRLEYLIDKGFEIGNHTLTHANLAELKTAQEINKQLGGNQKKMYEIIPGYKMLSLALPFGGINSSEELKEYIYKGEYDGIEYHNLVVFAVGANPALSPVNSKLNLLYAPRVRASGIEPVDCDLEWWLKALSREQQYVSDGDANTVTVPKSKQEQVDESKLKGKKLVVY